MKDPTVWCDLSEREQAELSNLLPPRYHLDIIHDDPEALAEAVGKIRDFWQECEEILARGKTKGLREERNQIAKELQQIEQHLLQQNQQIRELNTALSGEIQAQGYESVSASELAQENDRAAQILHQRTQAVYCLRQLDEEKHHARIRLKVAGEILYRKNNFLSTQMPELGSQKPDKPAHESLKKGEAGHRWAIEIGVKLVRNYKKCGYYYYQPDRPGPAEVFHGSKTTFLEWASEVISDNYKKSKVYNGLCAVGCYVKDNPGASKGLRPTVARTIRYARKHER